MEVSAYLHLAFCSTSLFGRLYDYENLQCYALSGRPSYTSDPLEGTDMHRQQSGIRARQNFWHRRLWLHFPWLDTSFALFPWFQAQMVAPPWTACCFFGTSVVVGTYCCCAGRRLDSWLSLAPVYLNFYFSALTILRSHTLSLPLYGFFLAVLPLTWILHLSYHPSASQSLWHFLALNSFSCLSYWILGYQIFCQEDRW